MRRAASVLVLLCGLALCHIPAARADDLARFGRVATLAPLCGLRDEDWSFDLRRAELGAATGTTRSDDRSLKAAPQSSQALARLSWAEHEALEEFAEDSPALGCAKLRTDVDMLDADRVVEEFRARRPRPAGS